MTSPAMHSYHRIEKNRIGIDKITLISDIRKY